MIALITVVFPVPGGPKINAISGVFNAASIASLCASLNTLSGNFFISIFVTGCS